MANPPDARQPAMPQVGDQPLAATGDQRLLQALTTEHFTLQTARSATIMETNGRSALFLSTVSSAVVALAFIGQVADDGQPFFLFALAVLPALFVLGLLTYLRLAQSASEDLLYSRAINRIRRFYLDLDPAAPSWFLLGGHDDIHGATANMGPVSSSRHLLSHTATMVAVGSTGKPTGWSPTTSTQCRKAPSRAAASRPLGREDGTGSITGGCATATSIGSRPPAPPRPRSLTSRVSP